MEAKKYEFFEHTADVKFRAYGKSREEMFSNAAIAMTAVLLKPETVQPKIKKKVMNQAKDVQRLLYDFLEDLIFLMDTEHFIVSKVELIKITEHQGKLQLESELLGDHAANYNFSGDIKSITYHDMYVEEKKDKFSAQVVLDV